MATEQLGVGDSTVTRVIPGPIQINGVTTAPTINPVAVTITTTTANIEANSVAINEIIDALAALGLVTKGS